MLSDLLPQLRWKDFDQITAEDLRFRIAQHALGCSVPRGDRAVERAPEDGVVRIFHDRRETCLRFLCALAFGDVNDVSENPDYVAFLALCLSAGPHPDLPPAT